jgi:arylsulfatase A-like enzyme
LGSVPSLVSGRYPVSAYHKTSTTIPGDTLPVPAASIGEGVPTIAGILKRHGYVTGAFITSALVNRRIWGVWEHFDHWESSVECSDGDCAEQINTQILEWLAGRPQEPWLCYVHYNDVHHPYGAPEKYSARFSAAYGELPIPKLRPMRARARKGDLRREELEHIVGMYDAEIAYLDDQICGLLRALDALGLGSNLLVVVTSDHGDEFYEHGGFGHTWTLYEELIRVPIIIWWPGHVPGVGVLDARVENVDVLPTILDLIEAEAPAGLEGSSLVPFFGGEGHSRTAFSRMWERPRVAVTRGRWKLWQDPSESLRLYDLETDPMEQHNLAAELPDTLRALKAALGEWDRSLAWLPEPAERPTGPALDSTAVARLRTLGYIQ